MSEVLPATFALDIATAIPITVMVYPRTDEPERFAAIVHWPPHIHPRLVEVALAQAMESVQRTIAVLAPETPDGTRARPPTPGAIESPVSMPADDQPWSMHCRGCGADEGQPHAANCPAISPPPDDGRAALAAPQIEECPICHWTAGVHRPACPYNRDFARPATTTGAAPPSPAPEMCPVCGQPLISGHRTNCPIRLNAEAVAKRLGNPCPCGTPDI